MIEIWHEKYLGKPYTAHFDSLRFVLRVVHNEFEPRLNIQTIPQMWNNENMMLNKLTEYFGRVSLPGARDGDIVLLRRAGPTAAPYLPEVC